MTSPKRIVQVAGFYAPTSGGLRTTVDALSAEYRRAGHDPVLVVPGSRAAEDRGHDGHRVEVRSPQLPGTPYRILVDHRAVRAALDRLRPDRIEVHDKIAARSIARWGADHDVPALLFSHERLDGILAGRVPAWFPLRAAARWWNGRLTAALPRCVAASRYAAAELEAVGASVDRIPLGVDLELFRPGPRFRPPVVVVAGRLSAEKRPELAIAALRLLVAAGVEVRLLMAGDGPLRAQLERAAQGLPVRFVGHLDRVGVARALASASVLLAPCPIESFGLAVLEGMAAGTPVVVSDEGGASELLAPGTGVAVPSRPDALAAAVVEVLSWGDAAGIAARRHAEAFPWGATAARMLAAHGLEDHAPTW